jgi:hypothetical protein
VTPPGVPTNVEALMGGSLKASVTWIAPDSNGGGEIKKYLVQIASASGSGARGQECSTTPPERVECSVAGLVGGDTYTFEVQAENSAGRSRLSSPSNSLTIPACTSSSLFDAAVRKEGFNPGDASYKELK